MPRKIFIFDTTLRDGEQSPGASLNSNEKLEIARQLKKLNVDVIEAGFPISSQEDFESVSSIAQEIKGTVICALARAVEADIERAGEALKYGGNTMLHTFIGTSDIHIQGQLKKTREQVLRMAVKAVKLAKSYCQEVEFSAMDATRTDLAYLCEIIQATIEAGATVINVADTVGYAIPENFGQLICDIFKNVPDINKVRISVHCHDDLGLASANAISGVMNGALQIECAVNGMGERAGNTALEEVTAIIKTNGEGFDSYTDINILEIANTSRLVSRLTGFDISPNKAIVGPNAFVHSSGIHQDGVLKERDTFEFLHKEEWGYGDVETIVLTSRSGKSAVKAILANLSLVIPEEAFLDFFHRFKELADKKKRVSKEDLQALVEMFLRGTGELSILTVSVSDTAEGYEANVVVQKGTETLIWSGFAKDGPVDAIIQAIQKGTSTEFELVECKTESIGAGADAQASAVVRIKFNGTVVRGKGLDTNTLKATATAYLDAVQRAQKRQAEEQAGFNPIQIGKPETLIVRKKYPLPPRPDAGFLLVGVRADQIAFFRSATWQGGHYKSGNGWMFFNTAQKADQVSFPQYRLGTTSHDHRHGLPNFYRKNRLLK